MKRSLAFVVAALVASALLSACGNKGDLVRPTPSTLPPPQTSTPEAPVPPPDAPAKPAQDSNGH
jgi:predicted small lipoprotein YifL